MNINKIIKCFLFLILLNLTTIAERVEECSLAVIVNKSNEIDSLSKAEIIRIYKGKKIKWKNGKKIVVINRLIHSDVRHRFYEIVLDAKTNTKFFLSGTPIPFKTLVMKSDFATRKMVSRIPGSIGYLALNQVDETVKVVCIIEDLSEGSESNQPE